jgi:serine/threonine protein kinase
MALKIIPMLTAGKNVEDVSREINVLRRCRHPNIVSYYGSATTASELWVLSLSLPLFIPHRTQHSNTRVRVRSCVRWYACVCGRA